MVAQSIHIAVIGFGVVTREDLGAGATSESVSRAAGTVVRVGARIAASAFCLRSARIVNTVVDVGAGLAVTVPAGGAGIAGEASIRRSHIMTCYDGDTGGPAAVPHTDTCVTLEGKLRE